MSLSPEDAVRETYRLALEDSLRKGLKTKDEFDQYRAIQVEAAERIDAEKDAFRANYHQRLAKARDVVLREHTSKTLDHPKPDWAVDTPPSAEKVDLQARNRVQADHEARLAMIRVDQTDQYSDLRQACKDRARHEIQERSQHAQSARKNHTKDAFNLTNQTSRHELGLPLRSGPSQT